MHVLGDDNKTLCAGVKLRCGMYNPGRPFPAARLRAPERKKPTEGAVGKDHFKSGEREKLVLNIGRPAPARLHSYNCLPTDQ